jgi:hypothetical protein
MAGAPAAAVQMPVYEYFKRGGFAADGKGELPSPARICLSSAGSAALVSVIAFPSEVVRVRLQAQEMRGPEAGHPHPKYAGVVDAFRSILRVEGVSGLYRGLTASLVRTIPNSAIGLLTFETLLRSATAFFASVDGRLADAVLADKT